MKNLLHHIISLGILTPSFPGKVINQLSKFLTTECTSNWDTFIGCDWSNKHQDYFYSKDINITKYPNLASVIKLVLTLSHEGHQLKGYHHQQYINRLQCWKAHFERLHALNAQIASTWKLFLNLHVKNINCTRSRVEKNQWESVEDQKAIILFETEDVKSQLTLLTKTSMMQEKECCVCRTSRKGKQYFFGEQSECFEKKKWGRKGRCCQVGASIITPGGEEEETKLFIDIESLCYVDVFILFCWKILSFYFCLFYHLFDTESLYLFPSLVFSYSFQRLMYWLHWLVFLINLNQFKSTLLTELWILLKPLLYVYLF